MNLIQLATVSTLAVGLVSTAQAIVIDNFNGPTQFTQASSGTASTFASPGSDNGEPEIWGSREFRITVTDPSANPSNDTSNFDFNMGVGGQDTFIISTDNNVTADHLIRWFGGDLASGFDITDGGTQDVLDLQYLFGDQISNAELTFVDTSGNQRTQVIALPIFTNGVNVGPMVVTFDLSFFSSAGTNQVDLTQVEEVLLNFDVPNEALDAQFGFLQTRSTGTLIVPAPGTALLALIGLAGLRRRSKSRK